MTTVTSKLSDDWTQHKLTCVTHDIIDTATDQRLPGVLQSQEVMEHNTSIETSISEESSLLSFPLEEKNTVM